MDQDPRMGFIAIGATNGSGDMCRLKQAKIFWSCLVLTFFSCIMKFNDAGDKGALFR